MSIKDDTVLLDVMRSSSTPMELRLGARKSLLEKGILKETEPITVLEKLIKMGAVDSIAYDIPMVFDRDDSNEFILLFHGAYLRNKAFMLVAGSLTKLLDPDKSSVKHWELFTKDDRHIKFVLMDEDYDIPLNRKVAFKIIYHVK